MPLFTDRARQRHGPPPFLLLVVTTMLGTLANTLAILAGSLLGLLFSKGIADEYKEITGEDWVAYEAPVEGQENLERRSLKAQMSAFDA